MKTKKVKKTTLIISAGLVISLGTLFSYQTYADSSPSITKLSEKKDQFAKEKEKLEKMPGNTEEEIKKKVEQGKKVKSLGIETGKLEAEVNPPDPKADLEYNLRSMKGVLAEAASFTTDESDPVKVEKLKKGLQTVEKMKVELASIEKDYKENKAPLNDLIKRFEKLQSTKVFE
ncbi:hypothetical protein P4H65_16665 [Paenibacillus chitinolyticus]|uniref:hypothetical protein n=1 Tax=Paenibacillus chitinolyticus TaxID=79263 RepID=UPI002DBEC5DA|nr:hypothetical protein [Paenibacillus chitinolyticus]MEC0247421.1 hypothetical protein [Paenibacillus chitinolyticus]